MFHPRIIFLTLCFVISASATAQGTPQVLPSQAVTYPDNADSLKRLVVDIFSAAKAKDEETESRLIDSLLLPADSHWFTDQFGSAYGPRMGERYEQSKSGLKDLISLIVKNDIQRGWTNSQVKQFIDSDSSPSPFDRILDNMNKTQPIYEVTFTDRGQALYFAPGKGPLMQNAGDLDGYFFFVDGRFRYVGSQVFLILSGGRPMRIHLNPNQMGIAIIKQVNPQFTPDAIIKGLSGGDIIVHVVIDTSGHVKELTVKHGDPTLANILVNALKQWRFAPTFLDGDAVEVETDFTETVTMSQ